MAINAYTGLMGHGKTYQAVKQVIVEQFANGRNIVTNIEGCNEELIKEYVLKNNSHLKEEDLGTIRIITDDDVTKPNFFPSEEVDDDGNVLKINQGVCNSGDIIVIDEAWKYWQKTEKLHKQHDTFFRKMRHYVNEKGHTSDLVVITQDHTMLNQSLKNLIEMLFVTKKLKTLGSLGETSFTLTIFEGNKTTRSCQIGHGVHKYDKNIFPLYKSYSKANAKETLIDERTNYFKGGYFKYSLIAALILVTSSVYYIISYVSEFSDKAKEQEIKSLALKNKKSEELAKPLISSKSPAVPVSSSSDTSRTKQIIGAVISDNRFLVFIKEDEKVRAINNPRCFGSGTFLICDIDNEKVSYYK